MRTPFHHLNAATLLALAAVVTSLASARPAAASKIPTATEILDSIDDVYRGTAAHGKMRMKVVTAHWQRELELEFWSKGTDRSLVRILAPRKEQGTATLMVERNVWNYLPKVNRVIKVPSSMMGGSWMGSHFTNDDLVKKNRMDDSFDCRTAFAGERDGRQLVELSCNAKPEAAVVWGKVDVLYDTAARLPLQLRYFDEELVLARTLHFERPTKIGERNLPMLIRIVPADKPNELTEVEYLSIAFDQALPDSLFTRQQLQR